MKKIHVLWMLLFLVLSTSCVSVNRLMKVQEGMSRQEISKIFGTPEYRQVLTEEWKSGNIEACLLFPGRV